MNPLIITAFTIGGAIAGFFTCAWLTAGKMADLEADNADSRELVKCWLEMANRADDLIHVASAQKSVKSGRIIAILSGDA